MAKVILGVNMSLDGFIHDANGSVAPLYPDFEAFQQSEQLQASIRSTGAVVMGRRSFEMGDPDFYADHYEFQTPIFVLTHHPPEQMPKQNEQLTFTFVSDGVESAIAQAKAAAGDKDVMIVGGADVAQQCLRAGLVDEIEVDIMPLLLGEGLRLLDKLGKQTIHLEQLSMEQSPVGGGISLVYRVYR